MERLTSTSILGIALLLLATCVRGQENVDGYNYFGRGSCQDSRGKMYSYLQRTVQFPSAEACGRGECERFGNSKSYRGFEYSVAKRCTCVFDADELPAVPNDPGAPEYVSKMDAGNDVISQVSGVPGTSCYQYGRNSAASLRWSLISAAASISIMYVMML